MSNRQLSSYESEQLKKEDHALLKQKGITIRLFRESMFKTWEIFYMKSEGGFLVNGGHIEKKTKDEAINELLKIARES